MNAVERFMDRLERAWDMTWNLLALVGNTLTKRHRDQ